MDQALQWVAGMLLTVSNVSPAPDFETADVSPENFATFIAAEVYGHWLVRNAVVSGLAPGITIFSGPVHSFFCAVDRQSERRGADYFSPRCF